MMPRPKSVLYVFLPCKKVYPLGVTYLAHFLHQHHPEAPQWILDLSQVTRPQRHAALRETISDFKPDLIAFSWRDIQLFAPHEGDGSLKYAFDFYYSMNPIKKLAASIQGLRHLWIYYSNLREHFTYLEQVRREFPQIQMTVGGGAFSVFSEPIIRRLPEGIVGIIGEGEDALLNLYEEKTIMNDRCIFRKGDQIITGTQKEVVKLDSSVQDPAYIESIFPQYKAYIDEPIGIQTKRGCPYDCQFCLYTYIEGKRVYTRPAENVVAEMKAFYDRWGTRRFWFADAQWIPGSKYYSHCTETLERIIASGMKIEWGAYIRTSLITKELAELMVKSGLGDTEVAITSGSQKVLDELKMGFRLDKLYEGCRHLKEAGFQGKIILNYSLNSPGDTEETLMESVASYKKIVEIMGESQVYPALFFLGIQPHTGLADRLVEEGYLPRNYNPFSMNPLMIKKLLYNPPPLGKIITRACLKAWENQKRTPTDPFAKRNIAYADDSLANIFEGNTGRAALLNLEAELKARGVPTVSSRE
ncbi:MAG: radical SAM protein [Candidatus Manganitrophus sp.]|nr:MAG: radical SAM protein [Candidatus Manganitrophus sp.]